MLQKVIFAICIILVIRGKSTNTKDCQCGIENREKVNSRIIGGHELNTMRYPWMAAIFVQKKGSDKWTFYCGGSIISNKIILTAAHCVDKINAENMQVLIGSIYLHTNDLRKVKRYKMHEMYNSITYENDIALLVLSEKIEFNENQRPICLPPEDMEESDKFRIAGWGKTETNSKSTLLLYVNIGKYSLTKCKQSWENRKEKVTHKNICAGNIGRDSCKGDSGGPLMQRSDGKIYAVGITSFGEVDCGSNKNAVYTKVRSYLKWLRENGAYAEYCDILV